MSVLVKLMSNKSYSAILVVRLSNDRSCNGCIFYDVICMCSYYKEGKYKSLFELIDNCPYDEFIKNSCNISNKDKYIVIGVYEFQYSLSASMYLSRYLFRKCHLPKL